MKQFLFSMFATATFIGSTTAQITINRADFAVSGSQLDSAVWKRLTKTGAVMPTMGSNQVWDYTALKDSTSTISADYFAPAAGFGALPPAFADATLAANISLSFQAFGYGARNFYKLDNTGYQFLGYATNGGGFSIASFTGGAKDSLVFPPQTMRFSTPQTWYSFPTTYNKVWKATFKDTSNFKLSVALLQMNQASGMRIATFKVVDTIAGWGTLKMRNPSGGAALNYAVLLQRENVTEVDSFFLYGAPAALELLSTFKLTQGAVTTSNTTHKFLGVGFKEPFMTVYTKSGDTVTSAYRAVLPGQGLTASNRELNEYAIDTKVFPNPTTEAITFEFQKTNSANWHIMIYNAAGQIVSLHRVDGAQGAVNQRVELSSALANGTYFYNLLDETSLIRANGQFILAH
jgi:Secretion system C-terminal sorting domain